METDELVAALREIAKVGQDTNNRMIKLETRYEPVPERLNRIESRVDDIESIPNRILAKLVYTIVGASSLAIVAFLFQRG